MSPSARPARNLALGFLIASLAASTTLAQATSAPGRPSPAPTPTGAALLRADVLGVFAHPDDETGVAATMASLALGQGRHVAHVYCTRGEGGGNMVGTQFGPALGLLREIELREALGILGVRQVHFLDRADFAYTENLGITLEKWGHEDTLRRLVRVVRALRPEVMITMNPAPTPGQHGNHQAAGWLAVEAFRAAADPGRFPEQIEVEGLATWQPRRLFLGGGPDSPSAVGVDVTRPLPDGSTPRDVAGLAMSRHRSQGFGGMASSPWFRRTTNQWFTPALTAVPLPAKASDLLAGLPAKPVEIPFPVPVATASEPAPEIAFRSRPAVARYQRFVAEHGLQKVSQSFSPDLPVVAGEPNRLPLVVPSSRRARDWGFRVPAGWKARFVPPGHVEVDVPTGAAEDATLVAEIRGVGEASVRLHPVPHLKVRRVGKLPWNSVDADPAWAALKPVAIGPGNTWQGKPNDEADFSGSFRIAHDGKSLFVEVRVHDDRIVSNIQPDDIKGHWRSDSVEIGIDPTAGAEHTLGCWKAGIFPFDSSGKVRGARDADANAGPLETRSPGTRLLSWRTADGYAVRVSIPFQEAGLKSGRPVRAGFNVFLYDGDKADAAPGENINRTRLAWAPRSGVQGRPEDWGRVDFE
jgi:LmbE family N-acetylglucosaminyl deacetylase